MLGSRDRRFVLSKAGRKAREGREDTSALGRAVLKGGGVAAGLADPAWAQ